MKFKLMEYNVVPNVDERNAFCIQSVDDYILYNEQKITDRDKFDEIKSVLMQYRNEIVKLNSENISNYKGGRQQMLTIQYEDGEVLRVIGNTPSNEMANLYSELKNKLISIIER